MHLTILVRGLKHDDSRLQTEFSLRNVENNFRQRFCSFIGKIKEMRFGSKMFLSVTNLATSYHVLPTHNVPCTMYFISLTF